jgi:subtilase family serine protease
VLSADATITAEDTQLCEAQATGVPAGGSADRACTALIPSTQPSGSYYIGAIVDSKALIAESNEENNTGVGNTVQVQYPDLTVSSVTAPAAVAPGNSYALIATVSSAPGPSPLLHPWVNFVLSPDASITADDTVLCEALLTGLASGSSADRACTALIPSTQPGGTYYIGAIVDSKALIAESNEDNNTGIGNTVQVQYPDLTVSSVTAPAAVAPGNSYVLLATVSSASGPSPNLHPWVKFVLSTDATITADDTQLCEAQATAVPSGGAADRACTAMIPGTQPSGTYYIGAIVDSKALIAESNEANNSAAGSTVQVVYPDLTVSSVTGPTSAVAGSSYPLLARVSSAAGPSPALHPWVKFVLSADATITADDTQVCEAQATGVPTGGSADRTCTALIPGSQPSGTYYIGAIADSKALIAESSEDNNSAVGNAVAVTYNAPDFTVSNVTAPASTTGGTSNTFGVTVRSAAGASPTLSPSVKFVLSADTSITASDTNLCDGQAAGLAPGKTVAAACTASLPTNQPTGTYYVGAIVDPYASFAETDEQNNAITGPIIQIASLPDLSAASFSAPTSAMDGAVISIDDAVANGESAVTAVRVGFYVSTDPEVTTGDVRIGGRWIPSLAAGATSAASTLVQLPYGLPANVYLAAIVDPESQVLEQSEENNVTAPWALNIGHDVAPPSLIVSAPLEGARVDRMVEVSGSASDASYFEVVVNSVPVPVGGEGSFSVTLVVDPGPQAITISAVDEAGNRASVTRNIVANASGASTVRFEHDAAGNLTGIFKTSTDPRNCGAIGNVCPPSGGAAGCCFEGTCGLSNDGRCVIVSADPENCGAIGNACRVPVYGSPVCLAGACDVACLPGYVMAANGDCTNPFTDPENCGVAGNACPTLQHGFATCMGGICGVSCDAGYSAVAGECSDMATDPGNCGFEGNVCGGPVPANAFPSCSAGVCGYTCPLQYSAVGGACIDLASDAANCGTIGHVCAGAEHGSAICVAGSCSLACQTGYALAASRCIDVSGDVLNCGAAGIVCPSDPNGTRTCAVGVCGMECSSGFVLFDGQCSETTDPNNCGTPGTVCASVSHGTGVCVAGTCVTLCDEGYVLRGSACLDLASDPFNCGAEGNICSAGEHGIPACLDGHCTLTCDEGYTATHATPDVWDPSVTWCVGPPRITGVQETREVSVPESYDPETGFIPTDVDYSASGPAPVSVISRGGWEEYPVVSVAPDGVYITTGIISSDVVSDDHGWWTRAPGERLGPLLASSIDPFPPVDRFIATFVFPLNPTDVLRFTRDRSVSEKVLHGGVVLRGENLLFDGTLNLANPVGTPVPGEPEGLYLNDRIVLPRFWGATERVAYVEYRSPRGHAATPWPLRWQGHAVFSAMRAEGSGPATCFEEAQGSWLTCEVCPDYMTYGRVITLTGAWLSDSLSVSLVTMADQWGHRTECEITDLYACRITAEEPLTQASASPPGPGEYYIVDDERMEIALPLDGPIERGLARVETASGYPQYTEDFPGRRGICVWNSDEHEPGCVTVDAVSKDWPVLLTCSSYDRSGQYSTSRYCEIGRAAAGFTFSTNGFDVSRIVSLNVFDDQSSIPASWRVLDSAHAAVDGITVANMKANQPYWLAAVLDDDSVVGSMFSVSRWKPPPPEPPEPPEDENPPIGIGGPSEPSYDGPSSGCTNGGGC